MKSFFECIPNISEGRRPEIIHMIADKLRTIGDLYLLNIDSNHSANRTVFTMIGSYEAILAASDSIASLSTRYIDMSVHSGVHPRIGAIDVFPIVPMSEKDLSLALQLAQEVGHLLHHDYGIPIYFYEKSASSSTRMALEHSRSGQYEGLLSKWTNNEASLPDLHPEKYDPKTGATVVGVRDFLIAYNVNLNTGNLKSAKSIARQIRSAGARDRPHRLPYLKAIGWNMSEFGLTQVSTNLTNFRVTNLHHVFEAVQLLASYQHIETNGSELVGLVPRAALIDCGQYYSSSSDEQTQLNSTVEKLGLNSLKPFSLDDHVLEHRLQQMNKNLKFY